MIYKLCVVLSAYVASQLCCGFEVNNVVQLNSDILHLMDNMVTKDDCENLISSIRNFIGGLHFTMLEILHYYNKTQSLSVGKCIIDKEKPKFIDKTYNLTALEIICGWEMEGVRYFKKVMNDANNTWTKFVNAYFECKDKPVMHFNFKQVSIKYS